MDRKLCGNCKSVLSSGEKRCPDCGAQVDGSSKRALLVGGAGAGLLLLMLGMCSSSGKNTSVGTAHAATHATPQRPEVAAAESPQSATKRKEAAQITANWLAAFKQLAASEGAPLETILESAHDVAVLGHMFDQKPGPSTARLIAAIEAVERMEKPAEEPVAPGEKPVLTLPKYDGARKISGKFVGKYDGGWLHRDGIVIESGGRHYIIQNAAPPMLGGTTHGFAGPCPMGVFASAGDKSPDVEVLNIGRNGREATRLCFADAEDVKNDQKAHREAVAQAKSSFAEAAKAHEAAVAEYAVAKSAWDARTEEQRNAPIAYERAVRELAEMAAKQAASSGLAVR